MIFDNQEEALAELSKHPTRTWVAYEEDGKWIARAYSFEERRENDEVQRESVEVVIPIRADLYADTLTDEDWINLGKFVAEMAAETRKRLIA